MVEAKAFETYRALVADDSSVMRHVLRGILGKLGLTDVLVAKNGQEALDLLTAGRQVDIVFADLKMPRLSGLQLLDRMRATEGLAGIPVVIVSSEAATDSILEAGRHGAASYLVKPFSLENVACVLRKLSGQATCPEGEG